VPEPVYATVVAAAKTAFRLLDLRITVTGAEHVPRAGGVVLASNHVSYLDFIFCGLGTQPAGRLVRFMAKESVFRHRVSGPLMRAMKHIPVDRAAGAASYQAALRALTAGEVVGVFPEATISRSFTIKDLKSGAARMAAAAGVPIVPMAVWGTQRLWTKGRPRTLTRRHIPISIVIGEPIAVPPITAESSAAPGSDSAAAPGSESAAEPGGAETAEVLDELRTRLSTLLDRAQRDYPERPDGPADGWWQPAHLGGTAPTPEQAAALDAQERRGRAGRAARAAE
jgi:1-acyl-sn-glycerol-3-phosphate acyltransferase